MTRLIGAHLSSSGGYYKALESIVKMGGNCLQIFSSSPRAWANANVENGKIDTFIKVKKESKIDPVYFHACYLINLGYDNEIGKKSRDSLIFELNLASKMGVKGSIVHTGSLNQGSTEVNYANLDSYKDVISNIEEILNVTPKNTFLILENAGNRKIGKDLGELAIIINAVKDSRVRICLDTCHLHAAGYKMRTKEEFEYFLKLFDRLIGLEKLEVIHLNDSRDPQGAFRDRHENIGKGEVGVDVFRNFLNHSKTHALPFILEVPGYDDLGPDKKNLDVVKTLIKAE